MIDHLLFNKQKFIPETDEVKQKLSDYDSLKAFHDKAISSKAYSGSYGGYRYIAYCDENGEIHWKTETKNI